MLIRKPAAANVDLQRVELNWRFAAKHTDHDAELTFGGIDFGNGTVKALEWAIDDVDNLALAEVDVVLGIFDAHALLNLGDFTV